MEKSRFPTHLHKSAYYWNLNELDALIGALERDNLLTPEELKEYIPSKSVDEIKKLMKSCISASEDEILAGATSSHSKRPLGESSLDIVQNSLLSFIPHQFSPAPGIARALNNIAEMELKADTLMLSPTSSRGFLRSFRQTSGPDLPRMYKFLASLFMPGSIETLDYESAAAVLDMAICLIAMVNRIMTHLPMFPGAGLTSKPAELSSTVYQTVDRIGNIIALLSACRQTALNRLNVCNKKLAQLPDSSPGTHMPPSGKHPYGSNLYSLPLPAPLCVMNEFKLPDNFSQNKQLSTHLATSLHNFCKLSEIKNDLEDPALMQKRILDFILNPLGIFAQKVSLINDAVALLHLLSGHYNRLFSRRLPKRFRKVERPCCAEVRHPEGNHGNIIDFTEEPLLIRSNRASKKSPSRPPLSYCDGKLRCFALSYISSSRNRKSKFRDPGRVLYRRVSSLVPNEHTDSYFEKTFVSTVDTMPSQEEREKH